MKRFLLILSVAFPSLVFAQPAITFNPADGATNVPTTGNLLIESDVAMFNTDASAIDATNVESLVQLLDASLNNVSFSATISGNKKTITVTPAGTLAELTTYTLIFAAVEDGGGVETTTQVISFTTGDFTDPSFNLARGVSNAGTSFTFLVNVSEGSTVYYVVDPDNATPNATEIAAGESNDNSTAESAGSFVVSANTDATHVTVTPLPYPDKYYIYYFAEDPSGNRSTPAKTGLPLLNSSSIQALGPFQFDLRVNVDEAATTYYVVTQSATKPTATQILAGQNESGGAPDKSGSFAVTAGNNIDATITGLTDGTTYYVHFLATDGNGNQTIVETETATTPDGTPPSVTVLSPADGSMTVDVSTSVFTITFNENIAIATSGASNPDDQVRLFENGVEVEAIDRNDITVGSNGSITTSGSMATITFVHDLLPNENYYILIGGQVFKDGSGNEFGGFASSDWNFTTSGVTLNNAVANICSGSFQAIGNIIISETGAGDFNNGAGQTLVLSLDNTAEFVLSNSGVSVGGTSADITSLSVSVGLTSLTVTYTVAGGTVVDNITISGLKVYATGSVSNTTIIRTGGTADQDGNNGTGGSSPDYATINVGLTAPGQPQLEASQDLIHCVDEDISAKTLTLVDQGAVTYYWYEDQSLSTLATSTASPTVNIVTDLGLTSPAVAGSYSFYVVTVSACQSAPPVEITLDVSVNPVADAGADRLGVDAVCPGTELTLGGNPTLQVPSAPGAYAYSWEYVEGTPEPNAEANPVYTVANASTVSTATYNFEVTVTDVNGCSGTDILTVEVKPTFTPYLLSPGSSSFTPTSPNQTLVGSPAGGVFTGVGVVQSNGSPVTYQFSPTVAHATDPNTLPKDFQIFYTVTSDGCTQSDYHIATFTISNSFFTNLQPQYCSNEYPNPTASTLSGVPLSLDQDAYDYVEARMLNWNNSQRFTYGPYNTQWVAGNFYADQSYVRHNNEIYRCNLLLGCSGFAPPDAGAPWVKEDNILRVKFNGLIRNYYEGNYGGNAGTPTVVQSGSTYEVNGKFYNYYVFGTNENYNNCPTCNYAYPAAYLEFERPQDIISQVWAWYPGYPFYMGEIVSYNNQVYRCIVNYAYGQPDITPSEWANVTNSNYTNGAVFHLETSPGSGIFTSGFYVRGQHVQINRNPTVFFSGLANGQDVCEFSVLDVDNAAGSPGSTYTLTGNYSNQSLVQEFFVRLDGSGVYNDGGGALVNNILNPGQADFDTKSAFQNSTGGSATLKNIEIQYKVDPGTKGSLTQACFGTSSVIVQVLENSTFDFDDIAVDPDGSVYCYTEEAKPLQAEFNNTVINGAAGSPNSVVYSGYGVNDLGNSQGKFNPGAAIEQLASGTTTQQSIPVTALYRDANQCQSTKVRTFKVNPDIQPSFTFGGRVNYCYEDISNAFSGHFQDFTVSPATVTSTGAYYIVHRDPADKRDTLQTVNSNNMSFTAQPLYDAVQTILSNRNFDANLNQTVNLNIIYTETLNAGKSCSESVIQPMVINPPVVLDIFGLNDGDILCRNDNNNVSQGNVVTFDGSVTGSGIFSMDDDLDFSAINPTLNGTVNTNSGQASINLLNAYNAASDNTDPRQVFLRYQYTAPGCTGPANVIKGFEISPPPALGFDPLVSPANGEVFCYDEAPVQLATIEQLNVVLSGYGVTDGGTGSGTATFNPELAFNTSVSNGGNLSMSQAIMVKARITDGNGCANENTIQYQVNPIPTATVNTGSLYYCYEDADRVIQGDQGIAWFRIEYVGVTTPYTEYYGDINTPDNQITFIPDTMFNRAVKKGASALTPVNFDLYYSVADADQCTNTVGPFTLSVANQIDVSIAGVDANDIFCSNETNGIKELSFNPFPADANKREFTINNGTPIPLLSDKYSFAPGLAGGNFTFKYVVISGNNCTNTEQLSINVLPSPEAIFSVSAACDSALIDYSPVATNNLPSAVYTWSLSDSTRTGQNIQHRFPGVSTYSVQLHVQYPAYNNDPQLACMDSLRLDQIVGPVPDMDFEFFNVCEEDQTTFVAAPDIPISTVSWDFGDGESTDLGFLASPVSPSSATTTGTFEQPMHTYGGAGNYIVTVIGRTAELFGGCADTLSREIAILKNWTPTPSAPAYDMAALDGGKGFWVKEDSHGNATWEFNTATKKVINTGEMAWVTHSTDPYKPGDVSYMNSPCFDLSAFSRPVLSLKHWTDTELSDGAVIQYSTDGGATWQRLGDVASGLEWYNRLTISSNPGNQIDLSSGWSISSPQQLEWATGKHTLDVIPSPRNQVRFRVAFSSFNNLEGRDGFAFNNVVIEERNRTVLVENFTNLQQTQNNANFSAFRTVNGAFNTEELVKLQYHHTSAQNAAGPDELNQDNPTDPNARAAFYGVSDAVRVFIDGGYGQFSDIATFGTTAIPPSLQTYFSLRSLVTSPVDISLAFEADPALEPADTLRTFNVKATVQATTGLGAPGQYNVFIAVAEKEVLDQVYVLRKFLPDASGTPLTSLSATDPAQEIYATYDMRHVTRLPNGDVAPFAVIVFVQHLETKDVLQTIMREDGTGSSSIVTGVETPGENVIRLYPNPADDVLNVILPGPVNEPTPVKLFDTFGKQVFDAEFKTGEHIKTIDTKSLSGGVYLIQLSTPRGIVRKKAMIVHD